MAGDQPPVEAPLSLTLLWLYLPIGLLVGFLAGLLGIGGGAVLVPAFLMAANAEGFPEQHAMHMALGTSLACILVSSLASMRAHQSLDAVSLPVVRAMAPAIFAGSLAGTFLAARLPAGPLKWIFLLFLLYVAQGLWRPVHPHPRGAMPSLAVMMAVGLLIGGFSSLVGIGGASLTVAFLLWASFGMHEAIGTSAALGFPIALAGALGYAWNGRQVADLPTWSLGYIYLPAFAGVTLTSFIAVPFGARTAHRLPVRQLRQIFAAVLGLIAARMLAAQLGWF
jgi:uncharacterized membrane protein YfcA